VLAQKFSLSAQKLDVDKFLAHSLFSTRNSKSSCLRAREAWHIHCKNFDVAESTLSSRNLTTKDCPLLNRIIIEKISPSLPGDLPVKTILGENFYVDAVIFCDGHESLRANLLYKFEKDRGWKSVEFQEQGNDIWRASFLPEKLGIYKFSLEASIDPFAKWKQDVAVKLKANVLEPLDIEQGILLLKNWLPQLNKNATKIVDEKISLLTSYKTNLSKEEITYFLEDERLQNIAKEIKDPSYVHYPKNLSVYVEPPLANFSAWYEFFPRSFGAKPEEHGTFKTAARNLEYIADLGLDIVYLPPIHPIGNKNRKGKNNSLKALAKDVGSPWAIGDSTGGHKAIHPALGSLEDFKSFQKTAEKLKLKIALDIAFQCSPDHPYLKEHPEWFQKRADGSIQFAENPPKKYEDIYPFDFYTKDRAALWNELKSIFEFWIDKGVTIFRVDNPHTKPFPFWQWLIKDIKAQNPEVLFLSEAFTRPHIMKYLAKIGFTQSYTYFTWRTHKKEIQEYIQELQDPKLMAYYRANFWPNTPDILSGPLREGTKTDFQIRFLLAATLSSNYGIYGPSFELNENKIRDSHSEEYLNSEKYELKWWNLNDKNSLAPFLRKVNQIRKQHPAFRSIRNISFHETANENLIAYSNYADGSSEIILTVINLDPLQKQVGLLNFTNKEHGYKMEESFVITDLLNEKTYQWKGDAHYIELNPTSFCAHIFSLQRKSKSHERN
jgi:starch synthase (maltosyl-transferring)